MEHVSVHPKPVRGRMDVWLGGTLPRELRILAERLAEQSMSEAAVDLEMPRSTLQGRARALRRAFERAGFEGSSLRRRQPRRTPGKGSGEGRV